jgi:hypothetical protein
MSGSPQLGKRRAVPRRAGDWLEQERRQTSFYSELSRLGRRALKRRALVIVIALAATTAVVAGQSWKKRAFEASVVFRLMEGDFRAGVAPETKPQLRAYIFDGVFTRSRCLALIKAHDLLPEKMRKDVNWAVETMRDSIDVEVARNYLLLDDDDAPRTASVIISYSDPDPHKAIAVVYDLARLLREHEATARYEQAAAALRGINRNVTGLRDRLSALQLRILKGEPRGVASQQPISELARITEELRQARRLQAEAGLRTDFERQHRGFRLEQVDMRTPQLPASPVRRLVVKGLLAFLVLLPIVGLFIGALDSRVYDSADVRRLGLHALGHVPPFAGMDGWEEAPRRQDARLER